MWKPDERTGFDRGLTLNNTDQNQTIKYDH